MTAPIWKQERDRQRAEKQGTNKSRSGGPLRKHNRRLNGSWHPRFDDPVYIGPFARWATAELERLGADYTAEDSRRGALGPEGQFVARLGWSVDSGKRRLWRHLNGEQIWVERADMIEWLVAANGPVEEYDQPVGEIFDRFCPTCAEQVTTGHDSVCPWCDTPTHGIEQVKLIPPRCNRPVVVVKPQTVVKHVPRVRRGKPFYLDVMLDRRRAALERFVETGSMWDAAATLNNDLFSSTESAYHGFRALLIREGWYEPDGRGIHGRPAVQAAVPRVRDALDSGRWKRVPRPKASPRNPSSMVTDRLVRDAKRLYDEGLSFLEVAQRLQHRTQHKHPDSLKSTLINEWNRRGWPRRTTAAAGHWVAPDGAARCSATNKDGSSCRKYARKGERTCPHHDPSFRARAVELATAASRKAFEDAVLLGPWALWCRLRRDEVGSAKELHRRFNGVVHYDTVADWCRAAGPTHVRSVRRSTIDRVLAEWGDGTTFESIYPVAVAA
jgi:hypothetical protein